MSTAPSRATSRDPDDNEGNGNDDEDSEDEWQPKKRRQVQKSNLKNELEFEVRYDITQSAPSFS